MRYKGRVQNGVVVFAEPVQLAPGTEVHVEPVVPQGTDFWESCSLEELARQQGVSVPASADDMLGGWPDDELDDGFEDVIASWRERELEHVE